jgi:hypothetical protein
MNPLKNPYVRIALGAVASQYFAPKLINRFVQPYMEDDEGNPLTPEDASIKRVNDVAQIGITASITATVFVLVGMITGESAETAAKAGPA